MEGVIEGEEKKRFKKFPPPSKREDLKCRWNRQGIETKKAYGVEPPQGVFSLKPFLLSAPPALARGEEKKIVVRDFYRACCNQARMRQKQRG
ncbi:MAG: hypothetical protein HZB82_07225 [Deltaproteobacteria bacterium]|nr:hypothetical protein [Deltaproteobacteria bacterium]